MDWSNLWSFIWIFFWSFAFIAYLFALFAIIGDLFRDHELNGWWKAVWILFLIFLPFLTALVYLIARGNGMAQRSAKAASDAQAATDAYIRQTAGGSASPSDEIAKAKALLDAGTISAQEYEAIKAKALGA
ncbi:SHOCT domain-containing protein [Agromyces sp. GXQ0307]|uniref:SHOCT domain-containing protein n=1 Tax=Agromyces sp. GXQ0307 TaxID=3377835 RepID=UPI00383B6C80